MDRIATPEAKLRALALFVVLVFLLGGGSRHDIASLALLRPLAFGFAIYALLVLRAGDLRSVRVPLALLLLLGGWMAAQLVPLPPMLWLDLPGRGLIADIYAAAGIDLPWRSLSLTPSRTLNSALSLSVPLAGLLLFAAQHKERRRSLMLVLWGAGLASVLLGMAQMAGPERGPLYLYAITNNGLPVGLFANRNHQALMVCFTILVSFYLVSTKAPQSAARGGGRQLLVMASTLAVLVCVPFLLIAGSRSGLLLGLVMVVGGALLVHLAHGAGRWQRRPTAHGRGSWKVACEFALLLALLVGVFVAQSRSLALDRLLATSGDFELRGQLWPVLSGMIGQNWLAGTGFGSFEFAYKQVEPVALLHPAYLNQAHNDWAQWLIEGGLPALAILAALVAWLGLRLVLLRRDLVCGQEQEAAIGLLIMLGCAAASLADYPLRVPSLMLVFALASGFIAAAEARPAPRPSASPNHGLGATPGEFAT